MDCAPVTHSLDYVGITRPHHTLHFLTDTDHWFKEIFFRTEVLRQEEFEDIREL